MIRRPPRSTQSRSSAASDVYKRQHVDVVPEGTGWTVPPFAGTIKDGRLYGRGSTDDKGPAIASIFALAAARAALQAQHIEPRNAIMLLFGTDEETGMADFDYYFKK